MPGAVRLPTGREAPPSRTITSSIFTVRFPTTRPSSPLSIAAILAAWRARAAQRFARLRRRDDIRHRILKWDIDKEMWVERKIESPNKGLDRAYIGESGATRRLGRAVNLRTLPNRQYNLARETYKHHGPYLPMIYEACSEGGYSYEYRHGVTSFGAFTYCLAAVLRRQAHAGKNISFEALLKETSRDLHELGYDQKPCLVGPGGLRSAKVSWAGAGSKARRSGKGS